MANEQLDSLLCHLRKRVAAETASDRELLDRFAERREEAAFAALVQRHGAMVLHVCRRVLANVHDAEDACQAVFLVLARTAGSIRKRDSLASWLHGVAVRTALALRRQIRRRQAREMAAAEQAPVVREEPSWREVSQVLDEELQRLPESLRAALILCYLEGLTRDEAAHKLGWTVSTLRGRLERGREQLRRRLTRRGLTLPAALLATLLSEQAASSALPAALAVTLVRAALPPTTGAAAGAAVVSPRAAALVEGVLKTMTLNKLKLTVVILMVLGLTGLGGGLLAERLLSAQEAAEPQDAPRAERGERDKDRPRRQEEAPAARPTEVDAKPEQARQQAQSRLNLKEIAVAMHNYNDAYGHLPPPAIYSGGAVGTLPTMPGMPGVGGMGAPRGMPGMQGMPGGRPGQGGAAGAGGGPPGGMMPPGMPGAPGMPGGGAAGPVAFHGKALLSWRVALLPFLGEQKLYGQFHLNESWDSPHNKKLLAKMPKVYAPPGAKTKEPYATYYQVFVGPGAIFQKHDVAYLPASISDGTSNTLLVVEAGHPVPWTKPEDLAFEAEEPLPELGGLFADLFNAACADGAVFAFSKKWQDDSLRGAITAAGGEVVDLDRFRVPVTAQEAALRDKNIRLKDALRRERAELEALRRDLALLREMNDDAASARLRKENEEMEKSLHSMQQEVQKMKKTITEMKRGANKEKKPRPGEK